MDGAVTPQAMGLNVRAARIAAAMAEDPARLGIAVETLESGAAVLDCGVAAPGGFEAGRLMAEACMGGLGRVQIAPLDYGEMRLPSVVVRTDHPAVSCLASQYAGWAIKPEGYFAMGSGPLRAVARVERELYERLGYIEEAGSAGVLVLESRSLPDDDVVAWIAEKSGVEPDRLALLVAPTASIAGGVQVAARVVETALHKLQELDFDTRRIRSAFGSAPIPPVAKNDLRAIGRTNDCVLYGGTVHLTVDAGDDELSTLAPRVPCVASPDYGEPFYDVFQRYGGDFYKVDPHLFSPAEVWLTSAQSGRTFHAGERNVEVLARSLFPA